AACRAYGPRPRPSASTRASDARPRSIPSRSHRRRSWSARTTGAPSASTRAANRDACSSMRATTREPSMRQTASRVAARSSMSDGAYLLAPAGLLLDVLVVGELREVRLVGHPAYLQLGSRTQGTAL